jgi:hypothetical protein
LEFVSISKFTTNLLTKFGAVHRTRIFNFIFDIKAYQITVKKLNRCKIKYNYCTLSYQKFVVNFAIDKNSNNIDFDVD